MLLTNVDYLYIVKQTDMTTQQTVTRRITGETYTVVSMTMVDAIQHYVLRNNKNNTTVNISIEKFLKYFS